ncbi:ladderlectin-like [Xenentodon cancila]
MLLFLFLVCLVLGAVPPSEQQAPKLLRGSCPMFWYSFNNHCYKYIATQMNWADAELHCLSEGANLVSIHSHEEENFIQMLIQNYDHGQGFTWIGLSDTHKEGTWFWSDGSKVGFTYWGNSQPDNAGGDEDCVHTNQRITKKWNDLQCSHLFPSVCKARPI